MGKWLSKGAVLWVLYDAGNVPPHLLSTLIVFAAHAGTDGRGAHPSAATVAMLTRKGERRAKRDIAELVELGLLAPGDARIVAHIRADRRPAVYDLPMPRGVTHDPPSDELRGVPQTTPYNGHGVVHRTARGVLQVPDGVVHRTPEEVLKTSGRRARDSASAQSPPADHPGWCGECHDETRMVGDDSPSRCPRCHPKVLIERERLKRTITYADARTLCIDAAAEFKTALSDPLASCAGSGIDQYRVAGAIVLRNRRARP